MNDNSERVTDPETAPDAFSTRERDYIRSELDMFFSTYPSVADGFMLRTWRGGTRAGQPKLPPAAVSMIERGLMHLDASSRPPRVFFTKAGLTLLRTMMADRRLANCRRLQSSALVLANSADSCSD